MQTKWECISENIKREIEYMITLHDHLSHTPYFLHNPKPYKKFILNQLFDSKSSFLYFITSNGAKEAAI